MLFEGTTLTDNLRQHAAAPKILNIPHPHLKYSKLPRIELTMLDPELKELEHKLNPDGSDSEWFSKLKLDDITCNCPHKIKFEKIFDKDDPTVDAMVWTACKHTTLAAAKRQMKLAPTPDPKIADDFVKHSMDIINKELGEQLTHFTYSVKDWMNHLNSKKQHALQHVINYYKGDITNIPKKELSNILRPHYTGILKEELQPLDGKPRMVCSIPQRTKYIMGPVTWTMEELFQDNLRGYCGGKNLDEMADMINSYLQEGFTEIYEGDGSAFDNTQDVSLKELDRQIYQKIENNIYHVPKEDFHKTSQALYKTMDIEYINQTKKKSLMRYKILGTVFSGDCDTTLMNTTRMVMYNRYVNDKAGLIYGKDYVCFSKGDDFTLMYKPYITEEQVNNIYYKYFLRSIPDPSNPSSLTFGLGQVLKYLKRGDASSISFCSLRAWFTTPAETSIYLTRDISKFMTLSKYSRKTKNYTIKQKIIYLKDQALALRKSYSKIKYFEYIASLYEQLANKLMKDTHITEKEIKKFITLQQVKNNIKNNQPQFDQKFFENLEHQNKDLVSHRKSIIKIQNNYWETMQAIEKTHVKTLTDEEAEYVSKQIDLEVMCEYIKSMYDVGPKQFY